MLEAGDRYDTMIGRRIESPFAADGGLVGEWPLPGDYYLSPQAGWCGVSPDGQMVGLRNHDVTEHEDGTITVSPSILVGSGPDRPTWHGYLERGVWRTC
jgi:hypothetical protein